MTGEVCLLEEAVRGFLLDASDAGVRAVLWTQEVRLESVVEIALAVGGRRYVRRALVRWARCLREGSIVGLELLPEDLASAVTSIKPFEIVAVGDR